MTQESDKSEWNQSKAIHGRLNVLFANAHTARLNEDFQTWLKTLYALLTESSSIITETELDNAWDKIEEAENGMSSLAETSAVHRRFSKAEIKIRNVLDNHDMMIERKQDMGIPGDT